MRLDPEPATAPVLVTGANGIVGRAVLTALSRKAIPAVAVVRSQSPPSLGAVSLDLCSEGANLVRDIAITPRAIVHLAAAVPHAAEFPDTETTADMTRRIDHAVATAADKWRIPVVYTSTCGLYDPLSPEPKTEESECKARSPYFAAKLDGERLFLKLSYCTVLRLSAAYGAGIRKSVVMAKFIENARAGRPIMLWGSGKREQDFIHSADVADCVLAAIERPGAGVLNVASGTATPMLELANVVMSAFGGGRIEFVAMPDPKEHETARYDISRAAQILNWAPRWSLLDGAKALVMENFRS